MKKIINIWYIVSGITILGMVLAFIIPFLMIKKTPPTNYTNSLKVGIVRQLGINEFSDGTKERVIVIIYSDSTSGATVLADSIYYNSLHIGDTIRVIEKVVTR